MKVRSNNVNVYTDVLKYNYRLIFQVLNSIKIPFKGFNDNIFSLNSTSSVTRLC
jgi:hypothetical protein